MGLMQGLHKDIRGIGVVAARKSLTCEILTAISLTLKRSPSNK